MSLEPKSPYSIPLYSQESNLVNRQQQEAERRLVQLLKFSSSTESLRTDTELAKKMIKTKIRISFEDARANLKRLEDKMFSQIESQLISNRSMNTSLRNIEYDINQLIGKLTSMPVLNDKDHEFMMSHVDASIKQIEKNYAILESYKKAELEKFIDGSGGRQDVNSLIRQKVDKINKFMEAENLNMNSDMMLKSKSNESQRDEGDYREWLLKPREQENSSEETNKSIQRSGSFELLDLEKELDLIDAIEDEEEEDERKFKFEEPMETNGLIVQDDGVSRIFYDIYNKPTEYWLWKAN